MACRYDGAHAPPRPRPARAVHQLQHDDAGAELYATLAAALQHQAEPPRRHRPHWHRGWRAPAAAVAAFVAMLLVAAAVPLRPPMPTPGALLVQLPDAGELGGEDLDGGATVDVHQDNGANLNARRVIPATPDKTWVRPPCPPKYATINGACWLQLTATPPCPDPTWEHGGRCYVALVKGERPPSSVEH